MAIKLNQGLGNPRFERSIKLYLIYDNPLVRMTVVGAQQSWAESEITNFQSALDPETLNPTPLWILSGIKFQNPDPDKNLLLRMVLMLNTKCFKVAVCLKAILWHFV